mmetsp:Transcript_25838/g.12211  ORF Transcript_25838/g.12211 Transcript_25838/m.12211 type:complete len:182 (+) Transcript_25838:67-612(+)
MKAVCVTPENWVELRKLPMPKKADPGHLIIKMEKCAINPGDKVFINGGFKPGSIPVSKHDIAGVSGAGKVVAIGEGVSPEYEGKYVSVYRSLKFSDKLIGTWCEYAQVHQHCCVILPSDVNLEEYAGSLVNVITPYAFVKQVTEEGHRGVLVTAGTSATGRAMLGVCLALGVPTISIVRNA